MGRMGRARLTMDKEEDDARPDPELLLVCRARRHAGRVRVRVRRIPRPSKRCRLPTSAAAPPHRTSVCATWARRQEGCMRHARATLRCWRGRLGGGPRARAARDLAAEWKSPPHRYQGEGLSSISPRWWLAWRSYRVGLLGRQMLRRRSRPLAPRVTPRQRARGLQPSGS